MGQFQVIDVVNISFCLFFWQMSFGRLLLFFYHKSEDLLISIMCAGNNKVKFLQYIV